MSTPAPNMRFDAFDGIRGVLALLVVLYHFPGETFLHGTLYFQTANAIVDLFFVFSGFVIVAAYEKPLAEGYGFRRFLIERFGRIYPIYLTMLLVFVATEAAMAPFMASYGLSGREPFTGDNSLPAIATNLLLIQGFGVHDGLTWNYPAWCLSVECGAYLFFAAAMAMPGRRFLPAALAAVVVMPLVLMAVSDRPMEETYRWGVLRAVYGFSAGALGFYLYRRLAVRPGVAGRSARWFTAAEILAMAAMLAAQMLLERTPFAVLIPFVLGPFLTVFAFQRGLVSKVAMLKPLTHLGVIALSIYVVHAWLLFRVVNVAALAERMTGVDLVRTVLHDGMPTTVLSLDLLWMNVATALVLAMVVGVCHLTHRFIELPAQERVRAFARRYRGERRPAPQPAPEVGRDRPALNPT